MGSDVNLVRHDLDQRLLLGDLVSYLHHPLQYLPLGNPFADVR